MPFLSFKGTTHTYLLKRSITHNNKKPSPLLNLIINYISERSPFQIFSLDDEYTWRFLSFLIILLCSSLANCSFWLKPKPLHLAADLSDSEEDFLSKNL